jgi:MoaA/NifB/PqqE/SkfB family radical SAM enzyme
LGALTVHFSGGEPLLREDVFELVSYARKLGLLTRINSNGILLNEENVKRLKAAGLTECAVSVDSAEPSVHDRFRGVPNLHERAIEGIRLLRRFGVPCRLLTVASKSSITEGLAKTIAMGRKLGVNYTYVVMPIAVGAWEGAYDQVLTQDELERIRVMQDLTFAHLELPTKRTNCCVYGKAILYVSANGDVTPCAFVPYVLGNVKETPLEVIWRRHCAGLKTVCRGDCPMNIPPRREALREHVAKVAEELRPAPAKIVSAR